jgi:hypothetical protein
MGAAEATTHNATPTRVGLVGVGGQGEVIDRGGLLCDLGNVHGGGGLGAEDAVCVKTVRGQGAAAAI